MNWAKTTRSTLPRRQAILAAIAILVSSLIVGATVYFACAFMLREEIERRFQALAAEREKQIEIYVNSQSSTIRQIASRTRLRELLTNISVATRDGGVASNSDLVIASRILSDAVKASESVREIAIVDDDWGHHRRG